MTNPKWETGPVKLVDELQEKCDYLGEGKS